MDSRQLFKRQMRCTGACFRFYLLYSFLLLSAFHGSHALDPYEQNHSIDTTYVLESIKIEGNTRTPERIILGELLLHQGDQFDQSLARVSRIRLLKLGLFESISMRLEPGTRRGNVLWVLVVTERPTIILNRAFLGVNIDKHSYAGLSFTELNLFGTGQSLTLAGSIKEGNSKAFSCSWLHPYLYETNWLLKLSGQYTDTKDQFDYEFTDYEIEYRRIELKFGIGKRKQEFLTINADVRFNFLKIYSIHSEDRTIVPYIPLDQRYQTALLLELNWDSRNNFYMPDAGIFASIKTEIGLPFSGNFNYSRGEFRVEYYFPFIRMNFFRFISSLGYCTGDTPFMFRFYKSASMRGYGQYPFLGLTFQDEAPRDTALTGSIEYHVPFRLKPNGKANKTELFLFSDMGSVFDREEYKNADMDVSIGCGLHLNTTFGVITLTLGFPL